MINGEVKSRADFSEWMRATDQWLIRMCGLDSGSIEDWCWHDSFKQGDKPRDAAREALEEMGF